jgi:hypothetical protein
MRKIWRISGFAHGSLRDSYVGEKRERLYAVAGGLVGIWAALALIAWLMMKI